MTRLPLLAELTQGLEHWHAALATGDRHARNAAGLPVDILVASGLDERIEEALGPHRRQARQASAEQQSLTILRQANSLAGALQELSADHLAIRHELDGRRGQPDRRRKPTRPPTHKTADAISTHLQPRQHHAALPCLCGAIALLAFTLGHVTAPLPPALPNIYLAPPPPLAPLR